MKFAAIILTIVLSSIGTNTCVGVKVKKVRKPVSKKAVEQYLMEEFQKLKADFVALKEENTAMKSDLAALQQKTICISDSSTDTEFIFSGCNVNVQNGKGSTGGTGTASAPNGVGNLIVGYNELAGVPLNRGGSHNLIIGFGHSYPSYGGFVAGIFNQILGPSSSVLGGGYNYVNPNTEVGVVVGGIYNQVDNSVYTVVTGNDGSSTGTTCNADYSTCP